eukprot:Hpha_TRINITY_DN15609_c2_g3::TRINITY_DN15609_c2_g3_i1::g.98718::m.98718
MVCFVASALFKRWLGSVVLKGRVGCHTNPIKIANLPPEGALPLRITGPQLHSRFPRLERPSRGLRLLFLRCLLLRQGRFLLRLLGRSGVDVCGAAGRPLCGGGLLCGSGAVDSHALDLLQSGELLPRFHICEHFFLALHKLEFLLQRQLLRLKLVFEDLPSLLPLPILPVDLLASLLFRPLPFLPRSLTPQSCLPFLCLARKRRFVTRLSLRMPKGRSDLNEFVLALPACPDVDEALLAAPLRLLLLPKLQLTLTLEFQLPATILHFFPLLEVLLFLRLFLRPHLVPLRRLRLKPTHHPRVDRPPLVLKNRPFVHVRKLLETTHDLPPPVPRLPCDLVALNVETLKLWQTLKELDQVLRLFALFFVDGKTVVRNVKRAECGALLQPLEVLQGGNPVVANLQRL